MKNQTTEIVFILDRSGSMDGLEADTIGGFNSTIKAQRKEEGTAFVTTVLFDDEIETLLREYKKLTGKGKAVRGAKKIGKSKKDYSYWHKFYE